MTKKRMWERGRGKMIRQLKKNQLRTANKIMLNQKLKLRRRINKMKNERFFKYSNSQEAGDIEGV